MVTASAVSGNWLVTSAGAKVDLVMRLKREVNAVGSTVWVADSSSYSAAFNVADGHFQILPDCHEHSIAALLDFCKAHHIRVILPTRDAELIWLVKHQSLIQAEGIWLICSPLETLEICQDKGKFYEWCIRLKLPVVPHVAFGTAFTQPLFARPRIGAGGQGCELITNAQAWNNFCKHRKATDWIVQHRWYAPEFTVDGLFDDKGVLAQSVVRRRIRVVGGESWVSQIVRCEPLDEFMRVCGSHLKFVGPVTLQAFYDPENGARLIEMNPRVGGARALSEEAGLCTFQRLVELWRGDVDAFHRMRFIDVGLMNLRYTTDIFRH